MSWSFSSLQVYENCPYQWHLKYIKKIPEPKAPAMERGSQIHEAIEHYLTGQREDLIETKFDDAIKFLKTVENLGVEEEWGYNEHWDIAPWKEAWLRMKLDAFYDKDEVVTIIDFKTGKSAYNQIKHTQQGQLYAIGTAKWFPNATTFDVKFWYLDEGKALTFKIPRQKIPFLKDGFNKRAQRIGTSQAPTPSKAKCKWCPYKLTQVCDYRVEE